MTRSRGVSSGILQPTPRRVAVADDVDKVERITDILKAVAHPLRLRIVAVFCARELPVNALAERLGAPEARVAAHG